MFNDTIFLFFLKSHFFVLNILNHNFYFESQFLLKWFTLWQILGFFTNKTKFSKKRNFVTGTNDVTRFTNLLTFLLMFFFIFKSFVCCYFSFIPFSKIELNFDIWTIENSAFYRLWISIPRSHKKKSHFDP